MIYMRYSTMPSPPNTQKLADSENTKSDQSVALKK